jgi:hypothetical protein
MRCSMPVPYWLPRYWQGRRDTKEEATLGAEIRLSTFPTSVEDGIAIFMS